MIFRYFQIFLDKHFLQYSSPACLHSTVKQILATTKLQIKNNPLTKLQKIPHLNYNAVKNERGQQNLQYQNAPPSRFESRMNFAHNFGPIMDHFTYLHLVPQVTKMQTL